MRKSGKNLNFRIRSLHPKSVNPVLHCLNIGNSVIRSHISIGWRIICTDRRISRVLCYYCCRSGKIISAICCRSSCSDQCCHSCPGRSSPKGIILCIHPQFFFMLMDKTDCPCQILTCRLLARTVNQCKGIISFFAKLQCCRKAVMHCPNIYETTACIDNGKPCIRLSPEEK